MMSFNHVKIDTSYFDNMTFGEMISQGFEWNTPDQNWGSTVIGLSKDAIAYFQDAINAMIENSCFLYYPAIQDPELFARALRNEVSQAVADQAPILQNLFFPQTMPDGSDGGKGQFNITDGGSSGERRADFGTKFPQAMLNGNIGDYGSDGSSRSVKRVDNKSTLDALTEMSKADYTYKDTITKIVERVETSGVFSAFIY